MVMTGCDEEPGKGSELLGTRYLSDKSVPSWFPCLGLPPQAGGDSSRHGIPFLTSASDPGASRLAAATCTLPSSHLPALLKIFVCPIAMMVELLSVCIIHVVTITHH